MGVMEHIEDQTAPVKKPQVRNKKTEPYDIPEWLSPAVVAWAEKKLRQKSSESREEVLNKLLIAYPGRNRNTMNQLVTKLRKNADLKTEQARVEEEVRERLKREEQEERFAREQRHSIRKELGLTDDEINVLEAQEG